jgi:hypothetical protein
MRARIATIALVLFAVTGPAAKAGPTEVNVRIEGRGGTLFEGPIVTEGHDIEASSDTQERSCDGINPNDPQNLTPGPTPTAASVDAMGLSGETFDGRWYGGYDDYFITRWGPDFEAEGMSWGVLVNNVYTEIGGCQYELSTGGEVLWAYDAFAGRPLLALLPVAAGYTSGTRPLTATAELGKPFVLEVLVYTKHEEAEPPDSPERTGSSPDEGADVSPVQTSAKGFEQIETESPETVKTNAEGEARITFTTPGWHRIKATAVNASGEEDAIRSNRMDVCVPAQGATGCGEPPAEDLVRTPPRYAGKITETHQQTEATGTIAGNPGETQSVPAGPGTTTPTARRASDPPGRLIVESVSAARVLLKFAAAGQGTVRIARQVGKGRHRRWRTVKTIAVKASRAERMEVKLPRLAAGRYRVSIDRDGGPTAVVKTLIVHRK